MKTRPSHRRAGGVILLAFLFAWPVAAQTTHTVLNTNDTGAGSLRDAIAGAVSGDTIVFHAGLDGMTITLVSAGLVINKDLVIDASALPNRVTISGGTTRRPFNVGQDDTATLQNLILTDGLGSSSGGGGIFNDGILTVIDCTISNCSAPLAGGIMNDGNSSLTLTRCLVEGNVATGVSGNGGGIYTRDPLIITDSTISNNSAPNDGGGLYISNDSVTMDGCTISGNTAGVDGGGIRSDTNLTTLTLTVTNSTFSGNTATAGFGGGLFNVGGRTILRSCTVTANTAPADQGSGVCSNNNTSTETEVGNSIIAGNNGSDADLDAAGTNSFTSLGSNLIGTGNATDDFIVAGDTLGQNPLLGTLQDNGGPTFTHAPLAGSPAIDTGSSSQAVDQRAKPRPSLAADDRGALEIQAELVYAANAGWIYWKGDIETDARVNEFICSGHLWAANVGWIVVGTGTPANGHQYQNNSNTDFGVNVTGFKCPAPGVHEAELRGFAWGPNFGWINFETMGDARIDLQTGKLRGYAWAPNLGWINLGEMHAGLNVLFESLPGGADSDSDGLADPYEMLHAGDLVTMDATTDSDGDRVLDLDEYRDDTDPFDLNDRIFILSVADGSTANQYEVTFTSKLSRIYEVQQNDDIQLPNWLVDLSPIKPAGSTTTVTVTGLGDATRHFWRVGSRRPLAP